MSYVLIDNVKYFQKDIYYIVGDNTTTAGNGVSSTSVSGEIVIQEKVNGLSVLEIGQYSFRYCSNINKITINAKIRSINTYCFSRCLSLQYLNIPSTLTFIGYCSIFLGNSNEDTQNLPMFIEFEPRVSKFFIDGWVFTGRSLYQIYYPSSVVPSYNNYYAFYSTTAAFICAPSVFDFYTKNTTTDLSKCPSPQYTTKPNKPVVSIRVASCVIVGMYQFGKVTIASYSIALTS
jgi:hypothetical protein